MHNDTYSDDGELAYAFEPSKHAHILYPFCLFSYLSNSADFASIAVLSGSWLLLGVSHIFDTISVFFAFCLTSFF